jgi:hypothetical protein
MARAIDITGQKFGRLTALHPLDERRDGRIVWQCICECGGVARVTFSSLRSGKTKSCGRLQKEIFRARDITGQRFGYLVALYPVGKNRSDKTMWRLRCDCGQEVERSILGLGTKTRSCGCLRREQARQRAYRHGGALPGNQVASLYGTWVQMKNRCSNPNSKTFKYYGGRGITFAPEWINFIPFRDYILQNLGPRPKGHTLDRIFNDEDYAPGNLRWAPHSTQMLNSRRSRLNKDIDVLIIQCFDEFRRKPRRSVSREVC